MAMKPTVSRLEKEFEGKAEFQALNIDETSKDVFEKYKFIGQPQFVIVSSNGDIISSRNGMQKYETLKADIEKVLAMP
jgi:thiol-disulfide isomerase/thioredoxin